MSRRKFWKAAKLGEKTFSCGVDDGRSVYPTTCHCGGKLRLRYGGNAEEFFIVRKDGKVGRRVSLTTDMFYDTPFLICQDCGREYER